MYKSVLAAAGISMALLGAPAQAGGGSPASFAVSYSDLDLSHAAGWQQLERRIDAAAHKACRLRDRASGTRQISIAASQCFAKARAQAKSQFAALGTPNKSGA
ncbi:MAG: UrcA family protein [Erythrobacter sp.]